MCQHGSACERVTQIRNKMEWAIPDHCKRHQKTNRAGVIRSIKVRELFLGRMFGEVLHVAATVKSGSVVKSHSRYPIDISPTGSPILYLPGGTPMPLLSPMHEEKVLESEAHWRCWFFDPMDQSQPSHHGISKEEYWSEGCLLLLVEVTCNRSTDEISTPKSKIEYSRARRKAHRHFSYRTF